MAKRKKPAAATPAPDLRHHAMATRSEFEREILQLCQQIVDLRYEAANPTKPATNQPKRAEFKHFHRLPLEIRTRIYELALDVHGVYHVGLSVTKFQRGELKAQDLELDSSALAIARKCTSQSADGIKRAFDGWHDHVARQGTSRSDYPYSVIANSWARGDILEKTPTEHMVRRMQALESRFVRRKIPSKGLALLLTCRWIYEEARLLPFSCNTFTFDDGRNFWAFVSSWLQDWQARALTTIHIDISHKFAGFDGVYRDGFFERLRGLQTLRINLLRPILVQQDDWLLRNWYTPCSYSAYHFFSARHELIGTGLGAANQFWRFQQLPLLKDVKVICEDADVDGMEMLPKELWHANVEFADKLRAAFLAKDLHAGPDIGTRFWKRVFGEDFDGEYMVRGHVHYFPWPKVLDSGK